jgi:NTP pyrophosphatase (non-canonical NTP hydrolase)
MGELGEAANAIKKLRRIEDGIANISDPERQLSAREEAVLKIADELADTLIYLDLLAQRLGVDLAAAVVSKFNAVSEKYGFPERLAETVR